MIRKQRRDELRAAGDACIGRPMTKAEFGRLLRHYAAGHVTLAAIRRDANEATRQRVIDERIATLPTRLTKEGTDR